MNIETYLAQRLPSVSSPEGIESPWLDIGPLTLVSGQLSVGDCTYFSGDQVICDTPPGIYQVQVKMIAFGSDRRFARLRAILHEQPYSTELFGNISVYFAKAGVCDFPAFAGEMQACLHDLEEYNKHYGYKLSEDYGRIAFDRDPTIAMVFTSTGWGDGNYPVYRLVFAEQTIGLEVEYIGADEEYLFEDATVGQIISGRRRKHSEEDIPDEV